MYCSDIKLAQSLERDDVLKIPKPRCSAAAVCLQKKPSPCGGWEGAQVWEHVQGAQEWFGSGGRRLCPPCLLAPVSGHRSPCLTLLHGVTANAAEAQGDWLARQRMLGPWWSSRSGAWCLSQGQGESSCAQLCSVKHLLAGQGQGEVISRETY